jgi:hypothetical protein
MNSTKMELYNPVTWNIFEQVDKLYGHTIINDLYRADEHTSNVIELVSEQLKQGLRR